jgi:tRNA pseudouridine13 synthase
MDYGGQNTQGMDDHVNRARALGMWFTTKNPVKALEMLPKRFSAETSIIKHLGREGQQRDFMGALLTITRGLRQMYIHAYQSYVWNHVATYRWTKYGTRVIEGDLVLVDTQNQVNTGSVDDDIPDMNGEMEDFYAQVQPLTAKDIASGKYTIFDIVLPQPGYDVMYPENDIGRYYKTFMGSDKGGHLDPYDMRRPQREFSMSGGYRHFIGRFQSKPEYIVRTYSDDNEQMYPTDLDIALQKKAAEQRAKQLEREAKAPSVAVWNEFAANVKTYDAVHDEELKRRRSEDPTPPVVRVHETWVETSNDGSLKRAKIAQHHNTEVQENLLGINDTDTKDAEDSTKVETGDSTTAKIEGLTDTQPSPATPVAPSVIEQTGQDFLLKRLQETARQMSESSRAATPTTAGTPTYGQKYSTPTTARNDNGSLAAGPTRPIISKPEFETIDEDVMTKFSPVNYVYDEKLNGDRIAVVLKFQLSSSCYATIVLRELMGTLEGEGKVIRPISPPQQY